MIHRFIDLLARVLEPNLVFLTSEGSPSSSYVLWTAGNLATPNRLDSTDISSASASDDYLADTELSPDGTEVLYCRVRRGLTPNQTIIRKVGFDDTNNVALYTDSGDLDAFGNTFPLQPTWRPDGNKILFRSKGSGTTLDLIKHMDTDGTNVATLYTSPSGARVETPYYNHDGTLIAWLEEVSGAGWARLKVANADGSSATTVHSETSPAGITSFAWAQSSDVLAFQRRASSAFNTTDWSWKKINADGTGLTTLYSIDRSSGYTSADFDPLAIKWSWLPAPPASTYDALAGEFVSYDDLEAGWSSYSDFDTGAVVTTIQVPSDPDPDHYLTAIFANGSGKVDYSPTQALATGTSDFRPVVFRNGTRIYFANANPATRLSSIKLDGSDERDDFVGSGAGPGGSSVVFHGFKGDTLNI